MFCKVVAQITLYSLSKHVNARKTLSDLEISLAFLSDVDNFEVLDVIVNQRKVASNRFACCLGLWNSRSGGRVSVEPAGKICSLTEREPAFLRTNCSRDRQR